MVENRKQFVTKDYKERFEFKFTVGENIICQRYFKINNFNDLCVHSCELSDTIERIVKMIDNELKSKTADYLEIFAPQYFNSVEDMKNFYSDEKNCERMKLGEGIVVKGSQLDYFWNGNEPRQLTFKFDDGELCNDITEEDRVTYKFTFLIDEKEVCSSIWEGVYPRFIRNAIDLSNKKGKIDEETISRLSFEDYLNYRVCVDRDDLVYKIIKEICSVCCLQGNNCYTTSVEIGDKTYKNYQSYRDLCKMYNLSFDGMIKFKNKK